MAPLWNPLYRAGVSSFPADILDMQVAEHSPEVRVISVVGEIDALTAPELAACLTAQLNIAKVVVANLDGVQFLASVGLHVLLEANELARREDRELLLVYNSQTANLALEIAGLREYFTFADSVPEALKRSP
jgi:anti-sigma B factor antagonist